MNKAICFLGVFIFGAIFGPVQPGFAQTVTPLSWAQRLSLSRAETELMASAWAEVKTQCPPGLALVPGGLYTLRDRSNPQRLPRQERIAGFLVANHEVTQAEFAAVMGYNPSASPGDDLPVNQVNLYNAIEYCNKRSLSEGLRPCYRLTLNGTKVIMDSIWNQDPGEDFLSWLECDFSADGYRLPTEEEWEFAAYRGQRLAGGLAEWCFSSQGSWDNYRLRGGKVKDPGQADPAYKRGYASAKSQQAELGFRVARSLPAQLRRYMALTVSGKLRVRDAPGLSGRELRQLPALTPLVVYETRGSAELRDGVYDYWFRVASDQQWVNANYVALLPFFTRVTGRVDSLSELKIDITDNPDIQEFGWGYFQIDSQTLGLADSGFAGAAGGLPLYPLPILREKAINPNKQLLGTWDLRTRYKNPAYAADPVAFDCDMPYFFGIRFLPGGKGGFYVDGDIGYIEMAWEFDPPNQLIFRADDRVYRCRAFLSDRNHLTLEAKDGAAFQRRWLSRGDLPYFETAAQASAYVAAQKGVPSALDEAGGNMLSDLLLQYHPDARGFWEVEIGLAKAGIALNLADDSGNTPLHYAASHWYDHVVAALIAQGAEVNFKNFAGQTPLDLVTNARWEDSHGDQAETIRLLQAAGAKYNRPESW